MKKLICIILSITLIATLGAVSIGASYPMSGYAESGYPSWAHGGSCYDTGSGAKGNAWASDPNAYNSVEIYGGIYGEWFDFGVNKGDIADAYTVTVAALGEYEFSMICSYYAWGTYPKK